MPSGPLAGRYSFLAAMALLALVPYLALSSALTPLTPYIQSSLHMSTQTLSLGLGLGNAGYAVGTILAVMLAQHLPQRLMIVIYSMAALLGSVLVASAQDPGMFIAGHILQGLCTSLLLISAVPPLALGFGPEKFRYTAVIMGICILGAVAAGPVFGGIQANAHAWRPLLWIAAAVSAMVVVLVLLTYDHTPPANRQAQKDPVAIGLAVTGSIAAFFGASELTSHAFVSAITIIPLFGGLLLILTLVVWETRSRNPLLPLGPLLESTIPLTGLVIALCAAAASVSVSGLTLALVTTQHGALHAGLLFLPELAGALIAAFALGAVLETKYLQYLPMVGMAFLAAGIVVFLIKVPSDSALTLIGSALTGLGLGGTVAPALFGSAFSLTAPNLQRVFAMIELLRAVAAFMIAPIFVHFVATVGGSAAAGTRDALWISLAIVVGGSALAAFTYFAGGARPRTPQMSTFLSGEGSAWPSPPLLARLRDTPGHAQNIPEDPASA